MARSPAVGTPPGTVKSADRGAKWHGSLDADIIIANAPDPVFVSDLEGKILQANDAVSQLLGFRQDEVLEQSLSRFISPQETREFTAALREVVERGVTRNARLNPRSASGEVIPTTLNASALRDADGKVIGAIGILRDMRAYEQVVRDLEKSKGELQEKILDLEKFEEVVVGRELKMIALEKELERLDNARRALLHILQDSHQDKLRLEASRKAMIHIMGDLRETSAEVERREQELRDKQEQLVQAGKLATLGELTTGVAHELNNPLNNIGLFVGNAVDLIELAVAEKGQIVRELRHAMQQVGKATEIISHLRTFGRAAPASRQAISLTQVIERALSLMGEQLRLREIEVTVDLGAEEPMVVGNPIQLEQVFINLLTNARDAVANSPRKAIHISGSVGSATVEVAFTDTGAGIPPALERRSFDPFFTTKEVGKGTGLGLSITYGIIKEHGGAISVVSPPGEGATFLISLPLASP